MLSQRRNNICTSSTLQHDLAVMKNVKVGASAVRKYLKSKGYRWLPRAQKREYSKEDKVARLHFAKKIDGMNAKALSEHICVAMDGVVLTVAPTDPVHRKNYCLHGESHMWRKRGEAAKPELSGDDPYADQIPLARALPLWGAISAKGYSDIVYHKTKKLSVPEWVGAIRSGHVMSAVRQLRSTRSGPYRLLCDNETFLNATACRPLYTRHKIELLHIPPRSPDLNPIERFWGWLRRELRLKDFQDLRAGRPTLGKTALKAR
eukprot:1366415-Karenia_brevis.AAC.1